ncbi:11337_t:CDS:2, partial [Funneliformis geosporum]
MPLHRQHKQSRSTISDIIKHQICDTVLKILGQCNKWKAVVETECSNKTFKHRSVKFPLFDRIINLWVENVTARGVILTDLLIKEKVRYFAKAFEISENEL